MTYSVDWEAFPLLNRNREVDGRAEGRQEGKGVEEGGVTVIGM